MAKSDREAVTQLAQMRRLSSEMEHLDRQIDTAPMGSPERLALLRRQASTSDARETLRDGRRR